MALKVTCDAAVFINLVYFEKFENLKIFFCSTIDKISDEFVKISENFEIFVIFWLHFESD